MESMEMRAFWRGKKVFLTGHTGFKGAWLLIWLDSLGAKTTGYALKPPTKPSLFELCGLDCRIKSHIGDVRDAAKLKKAMLAAVPEIVIHMAAQPLVRESYRIPAGTFATNVMGTVNLLEAVRACGSVKAVVNVTTDKCYEIRENSRRYKERDPLGGYDPYSSSKACSELATSAYRSSFFNPKDYGAHGAAVATARAGNVIGGGDWASDRLIPDIVRAALCGKKALIRNPKAVRPWQHVLEPLSGYLTLAQKLYQKGSVYARAWNFGPSEAKSVDWVVRGLFRKWPEAPGYVLDKARHPHEARCLELDSSAARRELCWLPRWSTSQAIDRVVAWTKAYQRKEDMRIVCLKQIADYTEAFKHKLSVV